MAKMSGRSFQILGRLSIVPVLSFILCAAICCLCSTVVANEVAQSAGRLEADDWGGPKVHVQQRDGKWSIEGLKNRVEIDPSNLQMTVYARSPLSRGQAWSMIPSFSGDLIVEKAGKAISCRLADAGKKLIWPYSTGFKTGVKIVLKNFHYDDAEIDLQISLFVCLQGKAEELVCELVPAEKTATILECFWPGAIADTCFDATVVPFMQGMLLPKDWPTKVWLYDSVCYGRGLYMPWWGHQKNKSAMLVLIETLADAGCRFEHPAGGPTKMQPRWIHSLGKLQYPRRVRYCFFDNGNYVDMAKRYRQHVKQTGHFISLKEKIARNPLVKQLIGCPVVHTGILSHIQSESRYYHKDDPAKNHQLVTFDQRAEQLRQLAGKGFAPALVPGEPLPQAAGLIYVHLDGWGFRGYDNLHPDILPPCLEAGSRPISPVHWTGCPRQWRGLIPRKGGDVFAIHDQYRDYYLDARSYDPRHTILDRNGNRPYSSIWYGGKQSILCPRLALGHVQKNYLSLLDHGVKVRGAYLDVFAVVPPDECYNPEHPASRADCLKYRGLCLDFIRATGGVVSSEEPADWAIPNIDLVHHGPYALVPDPGHGPAMGIPVPLFNLVYHDALLIPWSLGKGSWGIPQNDLGYLHALANAGLPYLSLHPSEQELQQVGTACALHERVGLLEMTKHEFLDKSFRKQRTTFADGTTVTIDLDKNDFEMWHGLPAHEITARMAVPPQANNSDAITQAREILEMAGVKGGIVVHLGCGDGKLTAALRASGRYTVHGLEADPAKVAEAKSYVQSQGIYGPVSIEQYSASALPYTDNLINLIVVQDAGKVLMDEVMRVLAPGGVACIARIPAFSRQGSLTGAGTSLPLRRQGWQKVVKPWPDDIDQWTHFLHDASNNAVAKDSVIGPPASLQWVAPPLWLRSHETPSGIQSAVSANGRLFYIFDEGLIGITDERLPDRWSLVCRDAFNGKLLWKRPLEAWGWRQWSLQRYQGIDWTTLRGARTDVPNENQRRIVADCDRLYTTLAYQAPMSILNAATGEVITTVEATRGTSEILVSDGIVVAYTREVPAGTAQRRGKEAGGARLVAVDGRTGKVLWEKQINQIQPLALAIDNGRIVYLSGRDLVALRLKDNDELWRVQPKLTTPRTLVAIQDTVVMQGGKFVAAYDATDGKLLWEKTVPAISGGEGDDLFIIDGLVWRGMLSVDDNGQPVGKSPHALVIGWDLRTGQEKKRILVKNLRSPEHHHRCYRNKATARYLIGSYEGAEFLDFQADNHSQNNWLRGACRFGMMPCNGMLYVPPNQCFCQPGAKFLGFAALTAGPDVPLSPAFAGAGLAPAQAGVEDQERLEKGPAYGKAFEPKSASVSNWPTFRHDAARSGSTPLGVPGDLSVAWKTELKGTLTAPVAWSGKVFVARSDAHTVYAIDGASGKVLWHFTAGGRIDSPPTVYSGMVLFGSADGRVYNLRASDGELVWRFLAAPTDRRIAYFDQIESAWPVHGSVLLDKGVAYFAAGRSTYLDGGIRLYGLDPATGKILHKGLLKGPNPFAEGQRDVAFFILGANSDVLVSEGGFLYMRQKKMTPELKEVKVEVLSSKGDQDVGLHIFSTAGLLDSSWYNRTFWMYSKRWPGFQLANQAPKSGQLLVVDDERTYAVCVFYRRNVHSPMFFPAREGYLLFADRNDNEPQIVGEQGSRKPVEWLPQSDYLRGSGNQIQKLDSEAFGLDKMIGYTRAEPPLWMRWLPVRILAMVKAGDTLFVAGPPDVLDPQDPYAAFEGRRRALLVGVCAADGNKLSEMPLEYPPVFDGMIAAGGRLYACLQDGSIVCLAGRKRQGLTAEHAEDAETED